MVTLGSILHFGKTRHIITTILIIPDVCSEMVKVLAGQEFDLRKNFSTKPSFVKKKSNKIKKKLASERCTKTKFPELLIHLGGAPCMCCEFQKHLPCVHKTWPKALQNPNFS